METLSRIDALVDTFVNNMKKSEIARRDLVVSHEKDEHDRSISLTVHIKFNHMMYVHNILFHNESSGWHIDNDPVTITDALITSALDERCRMFQTSNLHAIKYLHEFCEKTTWCMELFTLPSGSIESIAILIMKNEPDKRNPYCTIHLHKNDNFYDDNVLGRVNSGVLHKYKSANEFQFDNIQVLKDQIQSEYNKIEAATATVRVWTALGKIATLLEHHMSVNMPVLSG